MCWWVSQTRVVQARGMSGLQGTDSWRQQSRFSEASPWLTAEGKMVNEDSGQKEGSWGHPHLWLMVERRRQAGRWEVRVRSNLESAGKVGRGRIFREALMITGPKATLGWMQITTAAHMPRSNCYTGSLLYLFQLIPIFFNSKLKWNRLFWYQLLIYNNIILVC